MFRDASDPPVSIGMIISGPGPPEPELGDTLGLTDFSADIDPGPRESFRRSGSMLTRPVILDVCAADPARSLPESGGIPDELGSADDCGAGSGKPFPKYGWVLSGQVSWNAIENEHEGPPYEYGARLRKLDCDDDMDTGDGSTLAGVGRIELQVSQWAGLGSLPMRAHWRTVTFFGKDRNLYMCPVFTWWTSLETTPVTGSLLFAAPGCRLSDLSAGEIVLRVSRGSADLLLSGVRRVLQIFLWDYHRTEMAMGATARSGVDFNVQLQVSWNAPEAHVNLDYDGVYELKTVPNVLGLHARGRCGKSVARM